MYVTVLRFLFLLGALLVTGCAASRLTSVWRDAADSLRPVEHIVVFALFKDDSINQFVENEAMRHLPKTVHAEPGHMTGIQPTLEQAGSRNKLSAAGFDAVIITKLVSVDETETYHPPQMYFESDRWGFPRYYSSFWRSDPFAHATAFSAGFVSKDKRYIIETMLYRLPEGKPVWSVVSETLNPSSTQVMANEVVDLVNKQLQKSGLIGTR